MTERVPMRDLRRRARVLGPALLVLALAVGWIAPGVPGAELGREDAPDDAAAVFAAALDALPARATVLIGFDPDLGTYAEVRPTVRTALADLLRRESRLVFVSLTPEGRALAVAELGRLRRLETNPARLLDLGFVPGAEAALVDLARGPAVPPDASGVVARSVAAEGLGAVDAVLVVGGNDLGPRSWIEQVLPRAAASMPFLAVAPTVLLPELVPYLAHGPLDAAIATPRDGAAYRARVELGSLDRLAEDGDPAPATPILIGLLAAIGVLGSAAARRAIGRSDAGTEGRS